MEIREEEKLGTDHEEIPTKTSEEILDEFQIAEDKDTDEQNDSPFN